MSGFTLMLAKSGWVFARYSPDTVWKKLGAACAEGVKGRTMESTELSLAFQAY